MIPERPHLPRSARADEFLVLLMRAKVWQTHRVTAQPDPTRGCRG